MIKTLKSGALNPVIAVVATIVAVVASTYLLTSSSHISFTAHRFCLVDGRLVDLHVFADIVIFLSYEMIASYLFYFSVKSKYFRFRWLTAAFSTFIMACGLTHLMGVVVMWYPYYRWEAVVKMVCAWASFTVALAMPGVLRSLIKYARSVKR